MKHGSLFSGIGGFDLAAEWMGWDNVFHCEWNPFGQKILNYYWPNAISYHDITKTDFTIHRGTIDILTGGFPCQPYSTAGKRKGKEDERHLWPEMLRAIREIQPRYIVGENVRGLTDWNGGLVFDEVQIDLETEGFEVLPFLLPAAGKNAPHLRERIWFVAFNSIGSTSKSEGNLEEQNGGGISESDPETIFQSTNNLTHGFNNLSHESRIVANSIGSRFKTEGEFSFSTTQKRIGDNCGGWERFPIESPICDGDDGISSELDGITFSKWCKESLKAGGNAIVPQVAFEIFKAIQQYENQNGRKQ